METRAWESRGRRPQANDLADIRLLVHLGRPSFVMTTDFRFLAAVDAIRPCQQQWVRTPVELVEDRVWHCEPWGKPAKVVQNKFRRDEISRLKTRTQELRIRLKRKSFRHATRA